MPAKKYDHPVILGGFSCDKKDKDSFNKIMEAHGIKSNEMFLKIFNEWKKDRGFES